MLRWFEPHFDHKYGFPTPMTIGSLELGAPSVPGWDEQKRIISSQLSFRLVSRASFLLPTSDGHQLMHGFSRLISILFRERRWPYQGCPECSGGELAEPSPSAHPGQKEGFEEWGLPLPDRRRGRTLRVRERNQLQVRTFSLSSNIWSNLDWL